MPEDEPEEKRKTKPGWLDEPYPIDPETRQVSYHVTPAAKVDY